MYHTLCDHVYAIHHSESLPNGISPSKFVLINSLQISVVCDHSGPTLALFFHPHHLSVRLCIARMCKLESKKFLHGLLM
jgi:hypothetical protein